MTNPDRRLVEVIVKLVPLAATPDTAEHRSLQEHAERLGIAVKPLHPSTSDPDLASYAVALVDPTQAPFVVAQLNQLREVEGAYAKAWGEAPGGE